MINLTQRIADIKPSEENRSAPSDRPWVLVTGASRGIGSAIAQRLAADGYNLILHARAPSAHMESSCANVEQAGAENARTLFFDVSDRAAAAKALGQYLAEHDAPYGLVCNAGISRDGAFPALDPADWDAVLRTNLDGFFNVAHPLVMPMIRRRAAGRIVTLSSVSGITGNRGQVNYSAAKAGIIGATKALAVELASRAITVNCVAPGPIRTDMLDHAPVDEMLKMIPARRVGEPAEVASLVSYLMSKDAAYLTRQVISVNGGLC